MNVSKWDKKAGDYPMMLRTPVLLGFIEQRMYCRWPKQGEGYPDPSAFCSNRGRVLAEEICFIPCKHKVWSKLFINQMFTPDLMFTKYEADLLCQNITYITKKGRGVRVSHPVLRVIVATKPHGHPTSVTCRVNSFDIVCVCVLPLPRPNGQTYRLDFLYVGQVEGYLGQVHRSRS